MYFFIYILDITCNPDPPDIPTNPEYILASDDGTVTINSLVYPVYPNEQRTTNLVLNSTNSYSEFPKNYMTNLTYSCGSAREFFYADGSHSPTQSMTCQWDRTWTPTSVLGTCDWVACLRPPLPPASTNLRVTHWFGDPVPFGEDVMFVCERGYYFEDDYSLKGVNYTCEDGLNVGLEHLRGFFHTPDKDEDWPRCVLAPVCPEPPEIPTEGKREIISIPIPVEQYESCSLNEEDIFLGCNSFLEIFITDVTYGRNASSGYKLCNGDKADDILAPADDCFDDLVNEDVLENFRNECHSHHFCSPVVPSVTLSSECEGKRKEAQTKYICGKSIF